MIKINELTKRYGEFVAVDRLSFNVDAGEVLGFLGPNGAGKSTTMKMLAGFLAPTAGTASVCGFDIDNDAMQAKRVIGYLPEGAPAYGEMTPNRFLSFIADIRGLQGEQRKQRLGQVVEQLGLAKVLEQPIETLSKGFKRRVGIAQAILHDPKVLILDEPTDGLDPNQKHEVRNLIRSMAKDKLIIVSTHILEEVNAVCTRAMVIAGGKLLADETPEQFEARSRYFGAVSLQLDQDNIDAVKDSLQAMDGVAEVEFAGEQRLIALPKAGVRLFDAVHAMLREKNIAVHDLSVLRGRLDDVFRSITEQGVRS
jgi:ABC-2 type transport system ATP-binding protein